MDNGGDVWFVVLQGIFNQVLQKLTHLKRVGVKIGQVPKGDLSLGLHEPCFKISDDFTGNYGQVYFFERFSLGSYLRKLKQVINKY